MQELTYEFGLGDEMPESGDQIGLLLEFRLERRQMIAQHLTL